MKILMVCLGNICRSPLAQGVMEKQAEYLGVDIDVDSAGTAGYHIGKPADPRSIQVGERFGYSLHKQRSRKVTARDFEKFDLILAMDQANYDDLIQISPPQYHHKIKRLLSFCDVAELEVPDPYYGGDEAFEQVLDLIELGCKGVLDTLQHNLE